MRWPWLILGVGLGSAVPVVGVQLEVVHWWEPLEGLVLGAAWRGSTGLLGTGGHIVAFGAEWSFDY